MTKKREVNHKVRKLCKEGKTNRKSKVRISEGIILAESMLTEKRRIHSAVLLILR